MWNFLKYQMINLHNFSPPKSNEKLFQNKIKSTKNNLKLLQKYALKILEKKYFLKEYSRM